MKTIEAARNRWREILITFGVDEKFLQNRHGPCPLCGDGKDRFRWDNKNGDGSYYCSQCGSGSGMQMLMSFRNWDFATAAHEVDSVLGQVKPDRLQWEPSEEDKRNALRRLLAGSTYIPLDSPPWIYLKNRCGCSSSILKDLRYHPRVRHRDGKDYPAMLGVLRYPTNMGACIHRTYLDTNGTKAPVDPVRMMMPAPKPLIGSAIRLGNASDQIGIAEGLETAICAGHRFGVSVWSATSAQMLAGFIPPEGVRSVVICGDNDISFTGQAAAYELAHRLKTKFFDVEVQIPSIPGEDWADVYKK